MKINISKDKLIRVINHLRNAENAMKAGDQGSALAAIKISDNILSYAIFGEYIHKEYNVVNDDTFNKRSQHEIRQDLLNSRPFPDKCPTCGRAKDQKVAPPDKSIPGIQMGEVCTDTFHGELTVEDLMEMGM